MFGICAFEDGFGRKLHILSEINVLLLLPDLSPKSARPCPFAIDGETYKQNI